MKLLIPNSNVKASDIDGKSALMIAAEKGYEKIVELLIPKSDINASYAYGETALMFAARSGNEKIIELLIPGKESKILSHI